MIKPLPIQRSIYFTELPISLLATFMVGFLANANLFSAGTGLALSRIDGVILLFFFGLFMAYIFVVTRAKNESLELVQGEAETSILSNKKSTLFIIGGILALFVGGKFVVDGAIKIALYFELSETFIGLTVVAVGTSLPELVTSAVAAKKGQADMAVGNVIGSNIFNILWILGFSAVIMPLPFDVVTNMDILMVIFASTLLIFAVIVGKGTRVDRWEGSLFVMVYIAYIAYLVMRG